MHVIDQSVGGIQFQIRDVDGDGVPDVLALFKDGALRIYQNPGREKARGEWPRTEAGMAPGASIMALADAGPSRKLDFVTGVNSFIRTAAVHAAGESSEGQGNTEPLPDAPQLEWTALAAADIDRRHSVDLIAGSRYRNAQIGWFESLAEPGESAGWRWHPLADAGWVTAILAEDMDQDGDADILYSDRFGQHRGVFWMENPPRSSGKWTKHAVTADLPETVFLTTGDVDLDGMVDVVSAAKPDQVWLHRRRAMHGREWQSYRVKVPLTSGTVNAVRLTDLNRDGRPDLVIALEDAAVGQPGIVWLSYQRSFAEDSWRVQGISSPGGGTFQGLEVVDVDHDGDLDILTLDARNRGVVWYENPIVSRASSAKNKVVH
jgi:hypothetical protein